MHNAFFGNSEDPDEIQHNAAFHQSQNICKDKFDQNLVRKCLKFLNWVQNRNWCHTLVYLNLSD